MTITYFAPMYHTNQIPIIKGWKAQGDTVYFVSQYPGKTENHEDLVPVILGYSRLFHMINNVYHTLFAKKLARAAYPEAFKDKCGFPSLRKARAILREQRPDLVIVRERSVYSMRIYHLCKRMHIPCILYNQSPHRVASLQRRDFLHRLVDSLTPPCRMTPVYGDPAAKYADPGSYYIPFVMEPKQTPEQHLYLQKEHPRILCVAKYEARKNQRFLLEILRKHLEDYPFYITFVGEKSTPYHEDCYQELLSYITEHKLLDYVTCHINVPAENMAQFYQEADLFVLPSTGECASVSQLEAMSYSLPAIVSRANGTASYIEPGYNGYHFADGDCNDLEGKLMYYLQNPLLLSQMGRASYERITHHHSFLSYRNSLLAIADIHDPNKQEDFPCVES